VSQNSHDLEEALRIVGGSDCRQITHPNEQSPEYPHGDLDLAAATHMTGDETNIAMPVEGPLQATDPDGVAAETDLQNDTDIQVNQTTTTHSLGAITWRNTNFGDISRFCNQASLPDKVVDQLLDMVKGLTDSKPLPSNCRELRQAERDMIATADLKTHVCPIEQPKGKNGEAMMEYQAYELVCYNLIDTAIKLLATPEHAEYLHFRYEEAKDLELHTREFSEMWTGDWWKAEELTLPGCTGDILCIMISSDETHVTLTGRKMHPTYVYLGNYDRWFKNKQSGWSLLGFQPVIRSVRSFANSDLVRKYRRDVKRWVMEKILGELVQLRDSGILIYLPDAHGQTTVRRVYPRMPFFCGDEPEVVHSCTNTFGGACQRPCTFCDICPWDREHGLRGTGERRDAEVIRAWFDLETRTSTMPADWSKYLSVHTEFNLMFHIPGLNPFNNPACRMHQTDHGIFPLILRLIVRLFKRHGRKGSIKLFDNRWLPLKAYTGMKLFAKGVSDLSYVTAAEHRWMSMSLPFAVRGLDKELRVCRPHFELRPGLLEELSITYLCWRFLMGSDCVSEQRLENMKHIGDRLQLLIETLYMAVYDGAKIYEGPKYHKIAHWPDWIRLFGSSGNYNTEVLESAHKITVKKWTGSINFARTSMNAHSKLMHAANVYDLHVADGAIDRATSLDVRVADRQRAIDMAAVDADLDAILAEPEPSQTGSNPGDNPHVPDHPERQSFKRRNGRGGFWGRISLTKEFGLTDKCLNELVTLETGVGFEELTVEDVIEAYCGMLALQSAREEVTMLIKILNDTIAFTKIIHVSEEAADASGCDFGVIRLFWTDAQNLIQLWRKSWLSASKAYVSRDSDVCYIVQVGSRPDLRWGRVKWIISVNQQQFLIIQRFKADRPATSMPGPCVNESLDDRLSRQYVHTDSQQLDAVKDMLRFHCWSLELLHQDDIKSFDVVHLNSDVPNNQYPIQTIIFTQPDYLHCSSPNNKFSVASKFFLVEYIIHDSGH
jgi:hypothetical protein